MADLEHITAGTYELVAERFDKQTSKPGDPFTYQRYRKGDKVPLDEADARRLYAAGAVVKPGEREAVLALAARAQYEALLAQLPDEMRQQLLAGEIGSSAPAASTPAPEGGDGDAQPPAPEKPKRAAPKEDWVAYAVARGADQAAAEGASKEDLIRQFGGE